MMQCDQHENGAAGQLRAVVLHCCVIGWAACAGAGLPVPEQAP
jgi:hypothetical protein